MSKIVILDEKTTNQIAAGEVIERPSSVVKEMMENAIDAGATQITVEIRNGGISYIRITDNGNGMEEDDVEIAFERHATSKIRRIEDLDGLATMGFRGEALASIASVSMLEVTTKTREAANGTILKMEGGKVVAVSQTGCPDGTTFIVRNLFFNTPARYKFLKKDSTEAGYVSDIVERLSMAHPEISFKFIQNNQTLLHTPGNNDLLSVIYSIYGKEAAGSVLPVSYENEGISLSGFIGKPEISRGTRGRQSIFLNGRYIKSPVVTSAMEEAYKTMLMQNRYPFCVLIITASPEAFDVNVHPQKLEVRFANEGALYSTVFHGVKNTLLGTSLIREFETSGNSEPQKTEVVKDRPYNSPNRVSVPPAFGTAPSAFGSALQAGSQTSAEKSEPEPLLKQGSLFEEAPVRQEQQENTVTEYRNEAAGTNENNPPASPEAEASAGKSFSQEPQPLYKTAFESKDSSVAGLLEASIVGQAFETYIILQNGDNLYIIDQHAAHERIRYETLKRRLANGESFSQGVLEPFIIRLSAREFNFVMDNQIAFQELGFDLEAFGPNTIILRSIPDFYDSSFSVNDFHEILDRWIQTAPRSCGISDETLFMMSCKGAIKANRVLSREEISGLVESLCTMENPYTCVHGRPVILTLDKKELEKKFKRIV